MCILESWSWTKLLIVGRYAFLHDLFLTGSTQVQDNKRPPLLIMVSRFQFYIKFAFVEYRHPEPVQMMSVSLPTLMCYYMILPIHLTVVRLCYKQIHCYVLWIHLIDHPNKWLTWFIIILCWNEKYFYAACMLFIVNSFAHYYHRPPESLFRTFAKPLMRR